MVRPRLDRWWITRCTQPLSCLIFATGAWLSWQDFPGPFDWRRMVISTLLSPRDNPHGYVWIAVGIALSGLLLLPLGSYLHRTFRRRSPAGAGALRWLVALGGCGMVLIAAFAHVPPALPRLHDTLAVFTYCTLLAGMLTAALLLVRHPEATRLPTNRRRWLLLLLAVVLGPILATVSTQYVVYQSHGFAPAFHDGALPDYLNIAFWEWILSVLVYTAGWTMAWLMNTNEERGAAGQRA